MIEVATKLSSRMFAISRKEFAGIFKKMQVLDFIYPFDTLVVAGKETPNITSVHLNENGIQFLIDFKKEYEPSYQRFLSREIV